MTSVLLRAALLACSSLLLIPAAEAGTLVRVQGRLFDRAAQAPADGAHLLTVRLYPSELGGAPVWTDTLAIEVDGGVFVADLGSGAPLEPALFGGGRLWAGFAVDQDTELPLVPMTDAPRAAYADLAGDAATLEGLTADDLRYAAGAGVRIDGQEISLDGAFVEQAAASVCYDAPEEIFALTDGRYLDAAWRPGWADLAGVPPELADGDQRALPGDGLIADGETLDVDRAWTQGAAREVCYDSPSELHGALDGRYLGAAWRPRWSDVTGIPGDLLDGDQDTRYGAADGVVLNGTTFSADASVARMTNRYGGPMFYRAVVERIGSVLRYQSASGVIDSVDVNAVAAGATAFGPQGRIGYFYGNGTDSAVYLSIEEMPGHACMLLSDDDDRPRTGMYFATDSNSSMAWPGRPAPKLFELRREGHTGRSVIETDAKYSILCL
jgi:hypothetical protein